MGAGKASIPATRFYGPTRFDAPVNFFGGIVSTQPPSGIEALRLIGANLVGQLMQAFDYALQPIGAINTAGLSYGAFGDRLSAFPPGDVFNTAFSTLTNAADNISGNASGVRFGHGSGVVAMFWGTGAPGAAYPVTTGIPPNGSFYFRLDGAAATTIYQVRAAAWVGIV